MLGLNGPPNLDHRPYQPKRDGNTNAEVTQYKKIGLVGYTMSENVRQPTSQVHNTGLTHPYLDRCSHNSINAGRAFILHDLDNRLNYLNENFAQHY